MKNNDALALVVFGALFTGAGYLAYKLTKLAIDAENERAAKRKELEDTIRDEVTLRDYKNRIRKVSLYNANLDPHQRNIAIDILDDWFQTVQNSEDMDEFESNCENLEDLIDIFGSDDKEAILAVLDRRMQVEANRKLKAQREHELAMAKASGEKELNIAKIAAEAETGKARLYSESIKGVAEVLKEVRNEREQKTED